MLIDPYINHPVNASERRLVKCPVKEKDLKGTNLILITHEHFDHFDKKAVKTLAEKENAVVIGHHSVLNELDIPQRLKRPIERNKSVSFNSITARAVDVHHPTAFYPLGYEISCNGTKIFHAGDTDMNMAFNQIKANVLLLPIGGKTTMDCVDAVKAVKTIKPDFAIPMHYNTFEHIKVNPDEFVEKIEKSILKTKPVILKPGQEFNF